MKTQNILALLLFVFVFSACEKDEIQQQEATTQANQIVSSDSEEATLNNRTLTTSDDGPTQTETFANTLQWVSFATAKTLKAYPLARQEISSTMVLDGVYDLNTLLDLEGSYPNFSLRFRDVLSTIIGGRPDEEHEPNRPLIGGGNGISEAAHVVAFLEYILEDNCLELYIPNGLSSLSTAYSTTGHPLNTDIENFGFLRLAVPYENDGLTVRVEDIPHFNDAYVQSNPNVIIARPDRNTGFGTAEENINENCNYTQYSVDFDLFLDQ